MHVGAADITTASAVHCALSMTLVVLQLEATREVRKDAIQQIRPMFAASIDASDCGPVRKLSLQNGVVARIESTHRHISDNHSNH